MDSNGVLDMAKGSISRTAQGMTYFRILQQLYPGPFDSQVFYLHLYPLKRPRKSNDKQNLFQKTLFGVPSKEM